MSDYIDVVFDNRPGPISGRFIEVENPEGTSIRVGEWIRRDDGYWVLRIPMNRPQDREEQVWVEFAKSALAGDWADSESPLNETLPGKTASFYYARAADSMLKEWKKRYKKEPT